jgi:hypothetical protein
MIGTGENQSNWRKIRLRVLDIKSWGEHLDLTEMTQTQGWRKQYEELSMFVLFTKYY